MKKLIIIALVFLIELTGCNKEKPFSKKLMTGQVWNVISITVDGDAIAPKGQWLITTDVNIYDSVPSTWWVEGSEEAVFEWQFQEKGKIFQLSYVLQKEEVDGNFLDSLDYFTYYLSGRYNVEIHKKDQMVFTSQETVEYLGKQVRIEIEK